MGVATAVRTFVRLFGSAIVVPVASAIVNNRLRSALSDLKLPVNTVTDVLNDPTIIHTSSFTGQYGQSVVDNLVQSYYRGFKGVFYMTAACMGVAALSAAFLIEEHDLSREKTEEPSRTPSDSASESKADGVAEVA